MIIINNSQGNMSPPEPSSPTISGPEYFNISEAQEKDLKANYMKIASLKRKRINPLFKKVKENKNNWRKSINP